MLEKENICFPRFSFLVPYKRQIPSLKSLPHKPRFLMMLKKRAFENIVGKGENAGNQHFLLFPQCFLPYQIQILPFSPNLNCRLQML